MNTNPLRQNPGNIVFNTHVVVSNICLFLNHEHLKRLRFVNQATNYAVLLFMKQNGHRPTTHFETDGDISAFLNVMSNRTNQELPGFCCFNLALASTSLQSVEQFASSSSSDLLEFKFHYLDSEFNEHLAPEILDQQIASGQFCSKILAVLKKRSTQLQTILIRSSRDIPVENSKLEEFPEEFRNLRVLKAHYYSNGFQLTSDIVSTIVSRAPKLHLLEVFNFYWNNVWEYNALFWPRLVQVLDRPNPPFLRLRTRLMLQQDIHSLETLMRVKYNRLRSFFFVLQFDNQTDRDLLQRLSKFLKFQASSLRDLSIITAGEDVRHPLQLPELPNLKMLEVFSGLHFRQSAIQTLMPNQFPNLDTLAISGHNVYQEFLGSSNTLPSVKSLILNFDIFNVSQVEDAESTNTIHIQFPNLKRLELHDSSFMNLKRVDYVLNYLVNLEILVLNTSFTLKHRGGNAFWKTFAGKRFRLPKRAILKLCNRRPREPIVREERDTEWNTSRKLPSLGNLRSLQVLKITLSLATQLGALAFMARPECMLPLQKLHVKFTPGNSIDPDDQDDYMRMLKKFHHEVVVGETRGFRRFSI